MPPPTRLIINKIINQSAVLWPGALAEKLVRGMMKFEFARGRLIFSQLLKLKCFALVFRFVSWHNMHFHLARDTFGRFGDLKCLLSSVVVGSRVLLSSCVLSLFFLPWGGLQRPQGIPSSK